MFLFPKPDDYTVVDRSVKNATGESRSVFVLLGPDDSVIGQSFLTRDAAEERGTALAQTLA